MKLVALSILGICILTFITYLVYVKIRYLNWDPFDIDHTYRIVEKEGKFQIHRKRLGIWFEMRIIRFGNFCTFQVIGPLEFESNATAVETIQNNDSKACIVEASE